jgi:FtsP/CotA-like multicopper oxidase with cupredoxin domain
MRKHTSQTKGLSRRGFIKQGGMGAILTAGVAPYLTLNPRAFGNVPPTPFRFTPFTIPVPISPRAVPANITPANPNQPPGDANPVYHGIAPEYALNHVSRAGKNDWVSADRENPNYNWNLTQVENDANAALPRYQELRHHSVMQPARVQIIPGVSTPMYSYNGMVLGPTLRTRSGEPMVVRYTNNLGDVETSIHLHGAHTPSHSDGHPCFYVFPGKSRDYYYPNIVPRKKDGKLDWITESPSTMWYHDHGNDVTAHNVQHGLLGFCINTDHLEEKLMRDGVLPDVDLRDPVTKQLVKDANGAVRAGRYDVPLALCDMRLNADGTVYWDHFDHDGYLGDIICVNGAPQPVLEVEPRKYRLRLSACTLARHWVVRLSNGQPFLQLGNDTWLLPRAINQTEIYMNPAKRADVIVDFSRLAGQEIYLENIMQQTGGRKPDGIDRRAPMRVMKFRVSRPLDTRYKECTVVNGTPLRPHENILESEATVTRHFDFNRSNGAWQVNKEFYSAFRPDAPIISGATEKWVLRNGSGGWWHPIHIHVEAFQVIRYNGMTPKETWKYKSDNISLEGGTTAELLMKFRTFDGPFVFHCHNNNHEDMRMMKNMEICRNVRQGTRIVNGRRVAAPLPIPTLNNRWFSVPEPIVGIPHSYIQSHPALFS